MATSAAIAIGEEIAKAGFRKIAQKLCDSVVANVGQHLSALHESFSSDFEPHLRATFERCSLVKTILNRAEPVELLSLYVNTKFNINNKPMDDYTVIEKIHDLRRVVISGLGGGGKTIFMKYLWLSLFNDPKGKIPIFIELRRINDFTSDDLLTYIYRSIVDVRSKVTEKVFQKATSEGVFTFLLDGFDEVSEDRKQSIEKQILKLSHENPKTTIIVSGRPDPRFDAWQVFSTLNVLPLKQDQTIELISKLNYDRQTKRRFSERVKKDLYKSHESFLSSPLLTTMMLLTFDQFADIPEKIYIFFEQAFDTLFLRHDATKEGFQRKKHTDLPIDRFKRYFSYFCLITYYEQKLEFSETDMRAYAEKAFEANAVDVKAGEFIKDIVESVCIMQREGLNFIFTHRSFQEYFTAYCLANFIEDNFEDILSQLVSRRNDTVISMLLDMQRDKTESKFIIPALKKNLESARSRGCFQDPVSFVNHYGCKVHIENIEKKDGLYVVSRNSNYDLLLTVSRLYPEHFYAKDDFKKFKEKDGRAIRKLRSAYNIEKPARSVRFNGDSYSPGNKSTVTTVPMRELCETGFADYSTDLLGRMDALLNSLVERNEQAKRSIADILKLGKP